jgi:hypothetical protein
MILSLTLPPDLGASLAKEAERRGVTPAQCALDLLTQQLPSEERRRRLIALLSETVDDEDGDFDLLKALDEDRLSDRKLYPPELKGKTW